MIAGVTLAPLRRVARRLAAVAVALYASTGMLAAASACMPGPHRHHGAEAPDCVMHHHTGALGPGAHASGHDGHAGAHGARAAQNEPAGSAITCSCSSELRALHPADAALPATAEPGAPVMTATDVAAGFAPRFPSFDPQSSSPPPRA
jgi:hypothetical protein